MPNRSSNLSLSRCAAISLLLALGAVACGDDAKEKDDCPDGSVCDGAGTGGSAGTSGGGSGAGGGGSGAGGSSGSGGGASGTGGSGTDGGASGTGSTIPPAGKPATDGSQFASCDPSDDTSCGDGLACYTADGATPVGYCTKTCTADADCSALGASFTCSSATPGQSTQFCRATCAGADDDSCPSMMSCLPVTGGFRCLYDEKDLGTGTATAFQKCEIDGDCSGDLVCYPSGATTFGGATYAGACVAECTMDEECTDIPATGNVMPRCGGGGNCILDCAGGNVGPGGAADGGSPQCPDGMECANLGGGRQRCMYVDTTGGI